MKPDTLILPKLWTIPDSIRNRLGREAGPQRAMLEDGHLLIILHEIPKQSEQGRRPALFWRQPGGEWKSTHGGNGITALGDFLKGYENRLHALDAEEEKASSASAYHTVLEQIAPVLRASRGLHRALQQARDMVKTDRDLINFRDQASGIERAAELLLQDAQFGLNFTAARQAEAQAVTAQKMAATAHRLNLLAALFLPLTALASVFGMEIHSQLSDTVANFWLICAIGVLLGVGLSFAVVRRK